MGDQLTRRDQQLPIVRGPSIDQLVRAFDRENVVGLVAKEAHVVLSDVYVHGQQLRRASLTQAHQEWQDSGVTNPATDMAIKLDTVLYLNNMHQIDVVAGAVLHGIVANSGSYDDRSFWEKAAGALTGER